MQNKNIRDVDALSVQSVHVNASGKFSSCDLWPVMRPLELNFGSSKWLTA